MKKKLIIECEEVEQVAWWKTLKYLREGWKSRPFTIQIDYPFGFRNPFCNVFYRKPRTLREVGIDRFLHREVLDWGSAGDYGMGGAGFFALGLKKTENYPQEGLVLRLWGADNWILFDDETITPLYIPEGDRGKRGQIAYDKHGIAIYTGYDIDGQPTYTCKERAYKVEEVDRSKAHRFSSTIIGSELVCIVLEQSYSRFEFLKDGKYHKLEAPGKVWDTDEHIGDAWVVSRLANLKLDLV